MLAQPGAAAAWLGIRRVLSGGAPAVRGVGNAPGSCARRECLPYSGQAPVTVTSPPGLITSGIGAAAPPRPAPPCPTPPHAKKPVGAGLRAASRLLSRAFPVLIKLQNGGWAACLRSGR